MRREEEREFEFFERKSFPPRRGNQASDWHNHKLTVSSMTCTWAKMDIIPVGITNERKQRIVGKFQSTLTIVDFRWLSKWVCRSVRFCCESNTMAVVAVDFNLLVMHRIKSCCYLFRRQFCCLWQRRRRQRAQFFSHQQNIFGGLWVDRRTFDFFKYRRIPQLLIH